MANENTNLMTYKPLTVIIEASLRIATLYRTVPPVTGGGGV